MSKRHSRRNPEVEEEIQVGFRMAGIGMEVSSQVAAGALLGWLVDQWLGSDPKGLLTGSIIGIVVGLWSLIRRSIKLQKLLDQKSPLTGRGVPLPTEDDDTNDDENQP
ncbi:MAG: AtpZ/AtpI family protein [Planctomycetota bacterium]|nr:AtpZ/AtpI family protein [Planctomycetota bacterium]